MSLNGGQPRSLTTSSAGPENIDPSWSPDGRQIAFASNTEQYFQIYVTDTSGSNVWRITTQNNVDHYSPSWSPDGAEIAYAVNGNGYSEIYIANADGSNERLVTVSDGSFAGSLTWSPDGASLMFVVWSSSSSRTIRAINIDGSSVYQVTDSSVESDFPDWDSPDPISSIAQAGVMSIPASDFDTYPGGYRVEIYQYEIDTAADTIRMYFEATASQTDLRPPPGTYLATSSGNIAPTNLDWSSTGTTYYTGWFEFEGRYFRSSSGVSLIYCGCGFYSIPITDLSGYFTGSGHSSWNLFWDSDQVPCGNTTITYYDFESEAQFSADKSTFQRTVVGGDSPTYTLSPQGTYVLEHTYYDLDATVTSEVITVLSDNVLAGERVDNFSGCTLTVTYFMRRIQ
jgi:hypothetical protein